MIPDTHEGLVTIGEADSQPEFLVIRSLLESAGIDCYSPEVTSYYVKGKQSSKIIRIQVRASQADDAIAVLKDAESHPASPEDDTDDQR